MNVSRGGGIVTLTVPATQSCAPTTSGWSGWRNATVVRGVAVTNRGVGCGWGGLQDGGREWGSGGGGGWLLELDGDGVVGLDLGVESDGEWVVFGEVFFCSVVE